MHGWTDGQANRETYACLFLPHRALFALVPAVRHSLSVQRRHVRIQLDGVGGSVDVDARNLTLREREGELDGEGG